MQRNSKGRFGFTRIELIVVIAIIAILNAVLFPVFAQAREKARQVRAAQTRQPAAGAEAAPARTAARHRSALTTAATR